jgi:Mn2+/Fe2+ NRAMP family transporter
MLIPAAIMLALNFVIWLTHERTPRYSEVMLICLVAAMIAVYAVRMFLIFPNETPLVINYRAVIPRLIEFIRQLL